MDLFVHVTAFFLLCSLCTGEYYGEIGCKTSDFDLQACNYEENCTFTCASPCNSGGLSSSMWGTRIYACGTPLCLAALHDYRITQNYFKTKVSFVKKFEDREVFLPSIQQGISTYSYGRHNCYYSFSTPYFTEVILDVATLNFMYLYKRNNSLVQLCQINGKLGNLDFQSHMALSAMKNGRWNSTGWNEMQWTNSNVKPGGYWCNINNRTYSRVMSLAMASDADFVPEQWTLTASVGENVVIKFTPRQNNTVPMLAMWMKDERELDLFFNMKRSQNKTGYYLEIDKVDTGHAGIYSLEFTGPSYSQFFMKRGIMKLIVRRCPNGYFGPMCNKFCPDCLNDGVCHDIMGICICRPGFNGATCENECAPGYFGQNCTMSCNSSKHAVDKSCKTALICLPDPYGCSCAAGFKGLACDEAYAICDKEKLKICRTTYQKIDNCGRAKAFRACLTKIPSCPEERVNDMVRRAVNENSLDCKDEMTEGKCLKAIELQERTLAIFENMEKRLQYEADRSRQFKDDSIRQMERIAESLAVYSDNFVKAMKQDTRTDRPNNKE